MYETTSKHPVSCTMSVQYAIVGKTLMIENTYLELLGRRLDPGHKRHDIIPSLQRKRVCRAGEH